MQDPNSNRQDNIEQYDEVNNSKPVSREGVELVGKTIQERQPDNSSKPSLIKRYFDIGTKKQKTEPKTKTQPNVPEQFLLSWQAPEFVQTHKPMGWYIGFILFFLILIGIAIFTKQYLSIGLFVVMGLALLIYANRPPQTLNFQISNYGVYVGDKKYLFDNFDSYYETSDYGQTVIELVPNKRFGTLVSLPPQQEHLEELEHTLGQLLPKVENKEDFVDKLFRKLRF